MGGGFWGLGFAGVGKPWRVYRVSGVGFRPAWHLTKGDSEYNRVSVADPTSKSKPPDFRINKILMLGGRGGGRVLGYPNPKPSTLDSTNPKP